MAEQKPTSNGGSDEGELCDAVFRRRISNNVIREFVYYIMIGHLSDMFSNQLENVVMTWYLFMEGHVRFEYCNNNTTLQRLDHHQFVDRAVKALTSFCQVKYDITEQSIKLVTNSFVELFACLHKDEEDLLIPLHNIKMKVQDLVSERVWSSVGTDFHDIMFLPLFLTQFKCELWCCKGIRISLYSNKCAVLVNLTSTCSTMINAADVLGSIYTGDFEELFNNKVAFPEDVQQYVIIVFNFNTVNKTVTICSSHQKL